MMHPIFNLTPANYSPHALHHHDQNFRETNCFSDLIIEIVHGLGCNPVACLGYTLAADFEGDQWTFGKPSFQDVFDLYGIRIEELSLYKPLLQQMITQVTRGAISLVEVDSYYLPDTLGTDYQTGHVKTTIGITHIDAANKAMRYFHNAAFSELTGEDFDGIFTAPIIAQAGYLPPYCEIVKLENLQVLPETLLKKQARASAYLHLKRRPKFNPIRQHKASMAAHQQEIIAGGFAAYHTYTFVALRQLGAAHQLGAQFLRWLDADNPNIAQAIIAFDTISNTAKTLVLKLARVANSGKPADLTAAFDEMANAWDSATAALNLAFENR